MTALHQPLTQGTMYAVEIDFDEASKAWMANKIRNGPCMAYRCETITKKGQQCSKKAVPRSLATVHMCSNHLRYGKQAQ
jgi:hypothetical protein